MTRRPSARALLAALLLGSLLLVSCGSEPTLRFEEELRKLADPDGPPPDTSNAYATLPAAAALGKKLYFDPDLSGPSTLEDMLRRPMATPGRAEAGERTQVSCQSCHDVTRGGADQTADPPGHVVSFGAGAYDVNGQQTINSAYRDLVYWNGRNDSLWSQIVAVIESPVSVGGSRLRTAWRVADAYRAEYEAVFGGKYPLPPELDSIAAQKARLEADGTCTLVEGACPAEHCHEVTALSTTYCLPRFPLEGRPGFELFGYPPVCEWPYPPDTLQPNGDAYDCMQLADMRAVTRVYVNVAKAIAAYEHTLLSRDAPFDLWVRAGFPAGVLGEAAERGARLFVGKAACSACHSGPMLTDEKFHNIGVPQLGAYVPTTALCAEGTFCDCVSDDTSVPTNCLPWGFRDGLRKLQANRFRRDSVWSDDTECANHFTVHSDPNYAASHPDECDGRVAYYGQKLADEQKGAWKTPSLRDVALTGPYMHTGAYATLREVVEHYNRGGTSEAGERVGTLEPRMVPLNLTAQEIDDLVAFLETLTGTIDPAVTAPPEVPPASAF